MAKMEPNSIDAIVTDPPYSSGTRREASKGLYKSMVRGREDNEWFGSDCLTTNGFMWLMRSCALEWKRILKQGSHALVFIDWRMMPALAAAIESADLRHVGLIVWDKTYYGLGAYFRNQHELILHFTHGKSSPPQRRDVGNVLRHKPIRRGEHPTEKPVSLLRELISVVTPPGGLILDPFMGSGSTLIAAEQEGFRAIGIEVSAEYCEIAERRISASLK
jgi:site-specific DNA-methyltransferase (adenine-specific)